MMYNIIYNILNLPNQGANSSVVQASIAILVLSFLITLYCLYTFFGKIFSIK